MCGWGGVCGCTCTGCHMWCVEGKWGAPGKSGFRPSISPKMQPTDCKQTRVRRGVERTWLTHISAQADPTQTKTQNQNPSPTTPPNKTESPHAWRRTHPDVDGGGVLWAGEHDLRGPVPAGDDVPACACLCMVGWTVSKFGGVRVIGVEAEASLICIYTHARHALCQVVVLVLPGVGHPAGEAEVTDLFLVVVGWVYVVMCNCMGWVDG